MGGPPVSTNVEGEGDDGFVRVFIVPRRNVLGGSRSDLGSFLSSLFGLGRERTLQESDDVRPEVQDELNPAEAESRPRRCGLLCIFSIIESQIQGVQEQIDTVRDRENEVDFVPGGETDFDVNNSTHPTQVLEDWSVVPINKTTIADTNEDGSSFIFHKSVVTNISDPKEKNVGSVEGEFSVGEEIFE